MVFAMLCDGQMFGTNGLFKKGFASEVHANAGVQLV